MNQILLGMCMCACVRAFMRACVRVCVYMCAHPCVRACVRGCVGVCGGRSRRADTPSLLPVAAGARQDDYPDACEQFLDTSSPTADQFPIVCEFNYQGTYLAVGCNTGRCFIWDYDTNGLARSFMGHSRAVTCLRSVWLARCFLAYAHAPSGLQLVHRQPVPADRIDRLDVCALGCAVDDHRARDPLQFSRVVCPNQPTIQVRVVAHNCMRAS